MIHVLMVSLDTSLVTQPQGDSAQRHLAYARAAGKLTIIAYTPPGHRVVELSPELRIIPTNSRHKPLFAFDVLRVAAQVTNPVDLDHDPRSFPDRAGRLWLRRRFMRRCWCKTTAISLPTKCGWRRNRCATVSFIRLGSFVVKRADMYRTVNRKERENYLRQVDRRIALIVLPLGTASPAFAASSRTIRLLPKLRADLGLLPDAPSGAVGWLSGPFKRVSLLFKVFSWVVSATDPIARLVLIGDMSKSPQDLRALARNWALPTA